MTAVAPAAAGYVAFGPGDGRPSSTDPQPTGVPGFAFSAFAPLLSEAVRRCLGAPPADHLVGPAGAETAIVLATGFGDATSNDLASSKLARHELPNPILFHQAVPVSILGSISRDYGITGPVTCVSVRGDLAREAFAMTATVLADDDVDQVLLLGAELRPTSRTGRVRDLSDRVTLPSADVAAALLLRRTGADGVAAPTGRSVEELRELYGGVAGLVAACRDWSAALAR